MTITELAKDIENGVAMGLAVTTTAVAMGGAAVGFIPYTVGKGVFMYGSAVLGIASECAKSIKEKIEEENIKKQRVVTWLTVD